ncbi:hypothetical protein Droror1_Dr00002579 [Drosera rotundifolia]
MNPLCLFPPSPSLSALSALSASLGLRLHRGEWISLLHYWRLCSTAFDTTPPDKPSSGGEEEGVEDDGDGGGGSTCKKLVRRCGRVLDAEGEESG